MVYFKITVVYSTVLHCEVTTVNSSINKNCINTIQIYYAQNPSRQ